MESVLVDQAHTAGETRPEERRRARRIGVMWMATLRSSNGFAECVVIDISRGGAKLKLASAEPLPSAVSLVFDAYGCFRAETVWQRADIAGLRFLEAPDEIGAAFAGILPA